MKIIIYFFRNNLCNYGLQKENLQKEEDKLPQKGRNREKSSSQSKETGVFQESEIGHKPNERNKSGK